MVDPYKGWRPLESRARGMAERFGVVIQVQPKEGFLRLTAPFSAPQELALALDEIEEESVTICQFCGRPGAVDRQHQEWGYICCPSSIWVFLLDGGVAASCGF